MVIATFSRARDRLRSLGPDDNVCEAIAQAVDDVAPHVMAAVLTTDPATLLPSGGLVKGFSSADCVPFWDNELVDPDFNKFVDLARRHDPVASLAEAVEGDLHRSPRYSKLYVHAGVSDELRVAFVAGSSCLGVGVFLRCDGVFTPEEASDVRALVPTVTTALRQHQGRFQAEEYNLPPVVLVLDGQGMITSMSAGGRRLLDDLRVSNDDDFLTLVEVAAAKARLHRGAASLTTRLRGRSGRLLRLHVSPVESGDGSVVVTVETGRPDDLALAMLESYDLTPRETEIALLLCRGLTAKEIAAEMMISIHTVRDHVKAIYEKAGIRSRGELAAALFTNHVLDRLDDTVVHRP
jgi:DNA-binding CsgD family transcriptional regulator